jgi:hypothetical protein
MSQDIIRATFETTIKAWADAQVPAIPVAWQNVAFNPPAGRHARVDVLPAPTKKLTVDGVGRTWEGTAQVVFYMPQGTGAGAVEALAASLDAAFPDSILHGGVRVFLLEPFSQRAPLPHQDRFVVPVCASYRADTV